MKKKLLRNASLVALSAVMVCGTAFGLAGCNNKNTNTISISMFCGVDDRAINEAACNTWAEQYTQELIANGTWEEGHEPIKIDFSSDANTDSYFSTLMNQIASNSQPDVFYVSPKYVRTWSHIGRILDLSDYLAEDNETLSDIWDDSLAFYAYSESEEYQRGERIEYDEATGTYVGQNSGAEVGIYGLPKDFSNFGLSYNAIFFTDEVREALTTVTTNDRTGIRGAEYETANQTFFGESGVVTNPDGSDAPLINIGIPTTYKPYNFYRFASWEDALNGGDPMAWMVQLYTGGKGYTVTIPGFPGDTLEEAKKYWKDGANFDTTIPQDYQNAEAEYDESKAYVTYTYAEYGALTWALTYYFNTYNWDGAGVGGATTATGRKNVYGNDQYDGVLYLLPWLAGNNATYINEDSTNVVNGGDPTKIGTDTYQEAQVTLSGETEMVDIQYGMNSEAFIETLGAFYSYGSDWNGNSNNAGDTTNEKSSGWDMFIAGNLLFYGMGTWNGIETNKTDRGTLQTRLMPEPVSDDYSLYSEVKDADYEIKQYGDPNKDEFTAQEIFDNQLERQDKWGARMDSVGYGVSSAVLSDAEWKTEACVDLVKYLTIGKEMQVTLTYSGSQLPNFKSQCIDFMNNSGDFEEMITPDSENFDSVYQIAKDMYAAATGGASGTIGEWVKANHPDTAYDPQFESTPMSSVNSIAYGMKVLYLTGFTYSDRDLSLRMQFGLNFVRDSAMYTYNDDWITELDPRGDIAVMAYRQQVPLKTMSDVIDAMITSDRVQDSLNGVDGAIPKDGECYGTPAWWCLFKTKDCQDLLDKAIQEEQDLLGN